MKRKRSGRRRPDAQASAAPADAVASVFELKQPLERVEQGVRHAVLGFVAQRFQRRVQQLVDQAVERLADFQLLALAQIRQLVEQPAQLVFAWFAATPA